MLKRRLCEARFEWRLSCEGPLLIADGRVPKKTDEGKSLDKVFVSRTPQPVWASTLERARAAEDLRSLSFYVPGTSLRGPLRAQAERILRTVIPGDAPWTACDPFEQEKKASRSCSKRLNDEHADVPYKAACPACRLFGCTGTASRIQLSDADLLGYRSVFRDMIGIDRFTGGVYQGEHDETGTKTGGGANMRLHALEGSSFTTAVTITNFELWQLGLLAFAFRDFEEGLVPIGYGKTKGFGQVRGSIAKIQLTYPKGRAQGRIEHLQSLTTEAEQAQYGFHPCAAPDFELTGGTGSRLELYETFAVADTAKFWETVAPAFTDFIASRQTPEAG